MNEPFPAGPRPESVPPRSDKTSQVERESADDAAARARDSERIGNCSGTEKVCRTVNEFIHENPCLATGIAFGLGLIAGLGLRTDHR